MPNAIFVTILSFIPLICWSIFLWNKAKQSTLNKANRELSKMDAHYKEVIADKQHMITSLKKTHEQELSTMEVHYKGVIDDRERMITSLQRTHGQLQQLQQEVNDTILYLDALEQDVGIVETNSLHEPDLTSDELKSKRVMLQGKQSDMVRDGKAVQVATTSGKLSSELKNKQKQMLRCFNTECDLIFSKANLKNGEVSRGKIKKIFDLLNKLFGSDGMTISDSYFKCKLDELNLVLASKMAEEEEKEQRKLIREKLAEDERVRKELERKEQAIEKEETQFRQEVSKLTKYLQKASDDVEKQMYIKKIQELEQKLAEAESTKKDIANRSQNTRAGFVYIISNIGSFGPGVYKIGMTRRLEPLDRIAELSSASVPFKFDVHAMIFSPDAPALETTLHQHFADKRVNKVNAHKEFFRVSLNEIKQVVLQSHNATVKFIDDPEALEYYKTLELEQAS